MAWTAPRTWVASEIITAAIMNTHVRDNLKALGDAWTTYTPAWTATTTNPALGNGTIVAAYRAAGKTVDVRCRINMGSTTTYGAGTWELALPVAMHAGEGNVPLGRVWCRDSSASQDFVTGFAMMGTTASVVQFRGVTGNAASVVAGPTQPFTWADGDFLALQFSYEAA